MNTFLFKQYESFFEKVKTWLKNQSNDYNCIVMVKYVSIFFISAVLLITSCKKDEQPERNDIVVPVTDASIAQNFLNESYGTDSKQKFDIYLPANRSVQTTRVLFLIHGGGWSSGSKNDYDGAIGGLRAAFPDYAFVTVGYRLWENATNRFPVQEMDVKSCIEHVLNNGSNYHISTNFAVWGGSAGAHLALLYSYKYGPTSFEPKAIIEFAGPTDLKRLYYDTPSDAIRLLLTGVAGNINTSDSLMYINSSPVRYITPNSPPTLIVHGDADEVVHVGQALYLQQALNENGVDNVYKIYPGEGHAMSAGANTLALLEVINFLNTRMAD